MRSTNRARLRAHQLLEPWIIACTAISASASGGIPCSNPVGCPTGPLVVETYVDSITLPLMGGAVGAELSVPLYDGGSGPLVGVDLEIRFETFGDVCYGNLSRRTCPMASVDISTTLVGFQSLTAPLCDGFPLFYQVERAIQFTNVGPGELQCMDLLPDGACDGCSAASPIQIGPLTDPANLAAFVGVGLTSFDFMVESASAFQGCQPAELVVDEVAVVSVLVRYLICSGSDLPPVCAPDVATTQSGVPVAIAVLANDFDPEGMLVCDSLTIVVPPMHGFVSIQGCGGNGGTCPGCVLVYTPAAGFAGMDSFVYEVFDVARQGTMGCPVDITVQGSSEPPICPDEAGIELWPPNHQYVDLDLALLAGVVDPNGLPLAIVITGITQDEPINGPGDGNTVCDGRGVGTNVASIRAERAGGGDGRVYHVSYDATNSAGDSCSGVFVVTVPHSQNGAPAVDSGQSVDSTQGC